MNGGRTHAWLYGTGLLPLAEYTGAGTLRTVYVYAAGLTPVKMIRGGSSYHIVSDLLGSPRLVVDGSGRLSSGWTTTSSAVLNGHQPRLGQPFGFAAASTYFDTGLGALRGTRRCEHRAAGPGSILPSSAARTTCTPMWGTIR